MGHSLHLDFNIHFGLNRRLVLPDRLGGSLLSEEWLVFSHSASSPGHLLGPLANTFPFLPSNTLWPLPMVSEATEVLPSFLSHDANETETLASR